MHYKCKVQSVLRLLAYFLLIIGYTQTAYGQIDAARSDWYRNMSFYFLHPFAGTIEQRLSLLHSVKPEAIVVGYKHHDGYTSYNSRYGPTREVQDNKQTLEWLSILRKEGVKVICYYSGGMDDYQAEVHPDWRRKQADGTPYPGGALCFNSSYVDRILLPQVREMMVLYNPDMFWLDGDNWSVRLCYCPICKKLFRDKYGSDPPAEEDDPLMHEWRQFHREDLEGYLKKCADYIHRLDPKCLYGSNWAYSFFQPEPIPDYLDFLSGDPPGDNGALIADFSARYLSTQCKPFDVMPCNGVYGQGGLPKTKDHLMQEAATILANGGIWSVWDAGILPGWGREVQAGIPFPKYKEQIIAAAADFARERREVFHGTKSIPDIAILHSASTFYSEHNNQLYGFRNRPVLYPVLGAHLALIENHYHCDIVNEETLLQSINNYQTVILPEQVCLSEKVIEAIRRYVDSGGNVIATGLTACKRDEEGKTVSLLNYLFGIRSTNDDPKPDGYIRWEDFHLQIQKEFQSISVSTASVMFPLMKSDLNQNTETLKTPAVTVNNYGCGKAVYIGADILGAYWEKRYPMMQRLIGYIVSCANPNRLITTDAPSEVEFAARRKGNDMIVHLINRSVDKDFHYYEGAKYIEEVPKTCPISLKVRCDAKPTAVEFIPNQLQPEWNWEDGKVALRIPSVHIHAAVILRNAFK